MASTIAELPTGHKPAPKKLRQAAAAAATKTSTAAVTEIRPDGRDRRDKKRKQKVSSEEGDGDDAQTIPSEEKAKKRHKKRRRDPDAPVSPARNEDERDLTDENPTPKTPGKSVTFATDVKNDENDGAQADRTEVGETVVNDYDDDDDKAQEETREDKLRRKREKREQRRREPTGKKASPAAPLESKGEEMAPYETPVLSYLRHYYEDRSSWKFQKNRETHLLKHVLSVEQVPSRYNRALLAYLQGLKSEGARQRLRKTAQEAIKNDEENADGQDLSGDPKDQGRNGTENDNAGLATAPTGSDETSDRSEGEDYAQAIQTFRADLVAGRQDLGEAVDNQNRLERRKRAELVLWAVGGKISRSSSSAIRAEETSTPGGGDARNITVQTRRGALTTEKPSSTNIKDNAPKKKKRKNRTVVVDISSSSESSSDSET